MGNHRQRNDYCGVRKGDGITGILWKKSILDADPGGMRLVAGWLMLGVSCWVPDLQID
ncbi:hypothetical protein [Kaistella sp.]|uniref:hypothetical protein n=1 Tax=Kaistella sp. TaxID=2782235 RepID=UPI002F92FCBF